ncbi:probable serine/threonine-protein kinase At1g54610 [Benincasa hispida]|uniref:probable serine/threonine-protein kinase At1g54610 n=1 Tax=Benincasa hispida TaxID=102211 RepID=UPI0019014536|nr:probable serine/threonine-protein kinase At1g54610 [Benincasa hispida]XP_038901866.1 probable serine/threonine-protein kinase At1g54610 [Benincasa hispida]
MGCQCSKPSVDEDGKNRATEKFPSRKASRVNLLKKEEDMRLNSVKRDEDVRINSSQRADSIRSKVKTDGGDVKHAYLDKRVNGSNRVHDDQIEKKKREGLEAAISANYPGNGSIPKAMEAEQVAAGWPSWLSSVAGEALEGWLPRKAETFEKLDKIGQGTYSSVYKARDIIHNKLVALKRVRFDNLDVESVKFMAREILILRRLDHPNVIKLEGLITSPRSCSLYLVFEYMEHDLTGLASRPGVKFNEPQVKCYMQQLLRGLDYCHSRGVLHRDIKGSNLLIDDNGILKIADFGLASPFDPHNQVPLTSRVVTLWYRPPELLLGASHYGVAVDLWSTGCILAELYAGKPILPGKTEVEQLHKIFKLCGSPPENYWKKLQLPHSTGFKTAQPYRPCIGEMLKDFPSSAVALVDKLLSVDPAHRGTAAAALKSEFFTTKPLPCEPTSLPKYPPSKEIDAKFHGCRRQSRVEGKDLKDCVERRRPKEAHLNLSLNAKDEANMLMQKRQGHSSYKGRSGVFTPYGDETVSGFLNAPPKQNQSVTEICSDTGRISHSGPLISKPDWMKSRKQLDDHSMALDGSNLSALSHLVAVRSNISDHPYDRPGPSRSEVGRLPDFVRDSESTRKQDRIFYTHRVADSYRIEIEKACPKEQSLLAYGTDMNKLYTSGPILGPSNNLDKILKERDRQIQEYARQARHGKAANSQLKGSKATTGKHLMLSHGT